MIITRSKRHPPKDVEAGDSAQIDPANAGQDAGAGGGGDSPQRSIAPGFRRNMIIIGAAMAAALVLMIIMLVGAGSSKNKQAEPSRVEMGMGQATRADNMSPEMRRKLEEKQREEAAQAAEQNKSYVPPDPPAVLSPVAAGPGGAGQSALALGGAPVTQYANTTHSEADARRREGLQRQLAALMEVTSEGGVRQSIAHAAASAPGGASGAGAAAGASGSGPTRVSGPARAVLVPGLEISAGVLTSDLKIPEGASSYASARVVSGPAKGGFLVGQASVVPDGLSIRFTHMRLGNKVYAVDAIALDEGTAGSAVSANVDHRILQRYVFPVVLAAAQGFYTALAQTGSTVVDMGVGSVGIATPAPTSEQARNAGIATAATIAQNSVQKAAAAPLIVSREASYPIGLLFREPVYEDGAK